MGSGWMVLLGVGNENVLGILEERCVKSLKTYKLNCKMWVLIDCRDRWRWALHESGDFRVKFLTELAEEKILDVNNGGEVTIWNK